MNSKTKKCQNCDVSFTIDASDFEFYEKIDVPEPTFCPECRMQRRFAFRNERCLYKRKCDFSGKEIFSQFSPKAPIKVYDRDIWFSDKWDPMDYGRGYNFNKPFLKQLKELIKEVPWSSRTVQSMVNSDYSNGASFLKNCYLIFNAGNSEDCAYGNRVDQSKDCYDNSYIDKCEICYENFMISGCYKSFFSSNCIDCQEIYFCHDCIGCTNCFGCTNLRYKKYHIFNQSYTKQKYQKKIEEFNLGSYMIIQELISKTKKEHLKYPKKYMFGRKNVNATGEYIYNSKDVKNSFDVLDGENLKYCQFIGFKPGTTDSYDFTVFGINSRLVYETAIAGRGLNRIKFCYSVWPDCRNLEYCMECHSSSDLFGCIGLKHKQYCILNKQYSKKEYEVLVAKIKKQINEMPYLDKKDRIYKYGEFFPIELSPFAYNETTAREYFPLSKEEIIKQGYTWYDKTKAEYKLTIKAANLPDGIADTDNNILKEVIQCGNSDNCLGSGVFRLILN